MNRKTAKLIRGFCKVTGQGYRQFKKAYNTMSPEEKRQTKVGLHILWRENEEQGLIDHRRYYDLKLPLTKTLPKAG